MSALRAAGARVWVLSLPVDLLVGFAGKTALVEVKSGEKKKLTNLQEDFFKHWTGGTLARVDDAESALRLLKVMAA